MGHISRRAWIQRSALGAAALLGGAAHAKDDKQGCTLSIGTYAMPKMSVEEAITLVGSVGYDGIELHVKAGAHACPSTLSPERRKAVRSLLEDQGLALCALMEHIVPSENDEEHAKHVDRFKQAAALACDLSPKNPPLVQTVLGGGNWDEKKSLFLDRVADWTKATREAGVILAIKPHRGGGMSKPSEAAWLIDQLGKTPWLRMVYDYSHYAFREMPVEETVKTALPYTGHVVFKDVVQVAGKPTFQLPGESGSFDYVKLLNLFYAGGYRGDVCCEVSSQVWKRPDYDPVEAAKICYRNIAEVFKEAGVPRGCA